MRAGQCTQQPVFLCLDSSGQVEVKDKLPFRLSSFPYKGAVHG